MKNIIRILLILAPFYINAQVLNVNPTGSATVVGNGGIVMSNDSAIRFHGATTTWDDTFVPALAITTGASAPALTTGFGGSATIQAYYFQGSAVDDQCWFSVQIPHKAKVGGHLDPHVHWTTTTSASAGDTVVWELTYSYQKIGGNFTTATTTIVKQACAAGQQWQHQLAEFHAANITNLGISSIFMCRLRRLANGNASDTYTGNAALIGVDVHYEIDSIGSESETSKN